MQDWGFYKVVQKIFKKKYLTEMYFFQNFFKTSTLFFIRKKKRVSMQTFSGCSKAPNHERISEPETRWEGHLVWAEVSPCADNGGVDQNHGQHQKHPTIGRTFGPTRMSETETC